MTNQTNFSDIKKLSAYLDQQLSSSEHVRLEAKLVEQPDLEEILLDLRQARALLKKTPRQKVPRNFILTPKMVGMRPPVPHSVPVFRLASITAAVLLFFSFTINNLMPFASAPSLAAAPQFSGSGGGCGYDDPSECENPVMESVPFGIGGGSPETSTPEVESAMSLAPEIKDTISPEATPEASLRAMEQPTLDAYNAPPDLPALDAIPNQKTQSQTQPFLDPFQIGLVFLVIVCGIIAILIRQINILIWRKRL